MSRSVSRILADHALRRSHTLQGFGYRRLHPVVNALSYWYLYHLHGTSRAYQIMSGNYNRRIDFFTRTVRDELDRPIQVFLAMVTLLVIDSETGVVQAVERAFWRYGPTRHAFDACHNWVDCASGQDEPWSRACQRSIRPNLHYTTQILTPKRPRAVAWVRCIRAWATLLAR